jgi:hypothetical protein
MPQNHAAAGVGHGPERYVERMPLDSAVTEAARAKVRDEA